MIVHSPSHHHHPLSHTVAFIYSTTTMIVETSVTIDD